jgi:hypothetical protein
MQDHHAMIRIAEAYLVVAIFPINIVAHMVITVIITTAIMERQIEELFKYGDHVILFAVNAQLE